MPTNLIGDIHLGKRFPFTNKTTAARWEHVKQTLLDDILELPGEHIQLGDLFDDFTTDSTVFVQGFHFAKSCAALLSGNHDKSNNTDKESAMELLGHIGCNVIWDNIVCYAIKGINYVAVPHTLTQEAFEDNLTKAIGLATPTIPNVLLLHTNYGERPGTSTENYLRPDKAKELRNHFQFIISGHEHNAHEPLSGVFMSGSVLPMNFGEMTDKYVMTVKDSNLEKVLVWRASDNYLKLDYKDFLPLQVDTAVQFIEVVGTVDVSEVLLINKRIAEWYLKSESLIAIKNSTTSLKSEASETSAEKAHAVDWVETVSKLLTPDELQVFNELLGA